MKTLFIVRHGKSDWDNGNIRDIDRPLKERGVNDGYEMAGRCLEKGQVPQCIVTSPAVRAFHSAIIFARIFKLPETEFKIDYNLYLADADKILSVIFAFDDSVDQIMIFGHNPGFTDLSGELSHLGIMNVPTTGIVILEFDITRWRDISRNKILSERFDFPGKD